ncbi:MAG: hypothetical protein H3C47_09775 [Candidatus Cloacimonetes bacterium]|nr:hypothetical protein [Candidatus Cloacimonadota bacterium]
MPNFLLKRGKKEKLVMDVSSTGVRVAKVVLDNEVPFLKSAWVQGWNHRLSLSEEDFANHLNKVMKDLTNQFPAKQHSIVFLCSDGSNTQKFVQTANISDEDELEEFLISKKHYPDVEEYLSDNLVIGESVSEVKKTQDIMVRSVSKNIAQSAMDALEKSGYELEGLEYVGNALDAIYSLWYPDSGLEQEMLMHVSEEGVYLNFYRGGVLRFGYTINLNQIALIDSLVEKGHMERDRSRKLMMGDFFSSFYEGENLLSLPPDLLLEFKALMEWFESELKRAVAFYLCRVLEWHAPSLHRVILTGQETRSNGFLEKMRAMFQCPVEVFSLYENLGIVPDLKARMAWEEWGSQMLIASSLGTRYMED